MKSMRLLKLVALASVCAFALVVAVGCGSSAASSSGSGSASAASSSASAAASSASATSASASSSAAKSSAASSAASSQSASSASSASSQLTEEAALAQGYQVFKGTVHVCTPEELVKLQGVDIDPAMASSTNGTYAVLAFDQPTAVTGQSADGSGQRTDPDKKMLGIAEFSDYSSFVVEYGDLELCKSLDGQHVTLAAKAQDIMFPSDVRLPINEPSASAVVILS